MIESEIKAEMRLWALENLVCNMFAVSCLQQPSPLAIAEETRQVMLAGARGRAFPEVDAATSDLLSAELESAAARLMGIAIEQTTQILARRRQ